MDCGVYYQHNTFESFSKKTTAYRLTGVEAFLHVSLLLSQLSIAALVTVCECASSILMLMSIKAKMQQLEA